MRLLLFIAISLTGCSPNQLKSTNASLLGNWFFIDEAIDSTTSYHEVYIDTSQFRFRLGSTGLIPSRSYEIKEDTIFFDPDGSPIPFLRIERITSDSIFLNFIGSKPYRPLEYIRIKEVFDPFWDEQTPRSKRDSLFEINRLGFWNRYEEYLISSGKTTREELDRAEADSSNYLKIPPVEGMPLQNRLGNEEPIHNFEPLVPLPHSIWLLFLAPRKP